MLETATAVLANVDSIVSTSVGFVLSAVIGGMAYYIGHKQGFRRGVASK